MSRKLFTPKSIASTNETNPPPETAENSILFGGGNEIVATVTSFPAVNAVTDTEEKNESLLPFPIHCLPPVLKRYVEAKADSLQCPCECIALPLFSSAGVAIGCKRVIHPKIDWTLPPIIWGMVVANSSLNKSSACKQGVSPILNKQKFFNAEYKEAFKQHETKLKECKNKNKNKEEPAPPQCKKVSTADTTYERLVVDCNRSDGGLLWYVDELSMFFDRLKTGKTNNLAGVLSVHDGKVQTVSRKKDNEELIAPENMVVNVVGTIQPGTLKRMFREFNATENGLAYRFWYVGIKDHKIDHTIECQTSEEEMKLISNDLYVLFDRLWTLKPNIDGSPLALNVNERDRKSFELFLNTLEERKDTGDGDGIGKARGEIMKLSLILCLLDNPDTTGYIPEKYITGAIELWKYYDQHRRVIFDKLSMNSEDELAEAIVDVVRKNPGITEGKIKARLRSSLRTTQNDKLKAAISSLIAIRTITLNPVNSTKCYLSNA
ncbi:MAG: DUF3987 domain-containing protein [Verrucomicrobiae bacterium]|nr:DUF3987 domain-containing protein [Verrucomicrobiae bacterium]